MAGSLPGTVWIPRTREGGDAWAAPFRNAGMEVVFQPWQTYYPVDPPQDPWFFNPADRFAAMAVTSPRVLEYLPRDPGWLALPAFAVGPGTENALRNAGYEVKATGPGYAQALGETMMPYLGPEDRILFPCSEQAGRDLENTLSAHGVEVTRLHLYRATDLKVPPSVREQLAQSGQSAVLLSSAQARVFAAAIEEPGRKNFPVAAIGGPTAETLKNLGFRQVVTAPEPQPDSLGRAALAVWGKEETSP